MTTLFLNKYFNFIMHYIFTQKSKIQKHSFALSNKQLSFGELIQKTNTFTYSVSHQLILQNSVDSHTSSGGEQSTRKQDRLF
jgi:hypothetical protein